MSVGRDNEISNSSIDILQQKSSPTQEQGQQKTGEKFHI